MKFIEKIFGKKEVAPSKLTLKSNELAAWLEKEGESTFAELGAHIGHKYSEISTALEDLSIVDTNGIPVSGATVSGNWSIATFDSDSEMTDTNGNISLYSDEVKNAPSGTNFTFTVDNVVGGLTYNRDGNIETTDNIVV